MPAEPRFTEPTTDPLREPYRTQGVTLSLLLAKPVGGKWSKRLIRGQFGADLISQSRTDKVDTVQQLKGALWVCFSVN